jgi:hypothetical protein
MAANVYKDANFIHEKRMKSEKPYNVFPLTN